MKRQYLLSLFMLILLGSIAYSADKKIKIDRSKDVALVYYFAFEIERITGLHEEGELGIERYSQYRLTREDFNRAIIQQNSQTDFNSNEILYDNQNVRAKIIFSDNEIYFIDYDENFSGNNLFGTIDRSKFSESLMAK